MGSVTLNLTLCTDVFVHTTAFIFVLHETLLASLQAFFILFSCNW